MSKLGACLAQHTSANACQRTVLLSYQSMRMRMRQQVSTRVQASNSPCVQHLVLAVDACSDLAVTNQPLQLLHQRPDSVCVGGWVGGTNMKQAVRPSRRAHKQTKVHSDRCAICLALAPIVGTTKIVPVLQGMLVHLWVQHVCVVTPVTSSHVLTALCCDKQRPNSL